jgi:hypothetical protein
MKRLLLGAMVLALVAGCGSDGGTPAALPVGQAGGGAEKALAADSRLAGRTTYHYAGELPDLTDHAAAYTFERDESQLDEVAHALGTRTGLEAPKGSPSWSFSRDGGMSGGSAVSSSGCASAPGDDIACKVEEPKRPEGMPSKAEAEQEGRDLLRKLGVDLDHATVRVDDGFSSWNVTADAEVDGMPVVGMSTSVAIGPHGRVEYANGWLGDPSKGDDYPLITAKAALQQLQDQQVTTMMMPVCEDAAASCPAPEPMTVEVTDVDLGLQLFWVGEDEPVYLVPSFIFTTDDGGQLPVIAVEERYLTKPEGPKEKPVPSPEPHPNGEQCVSVDAETFGLEACGPSSPALDEPATFRITATGECAPRVVIHWNDGTPDSTVTPDPAEKVLHTYRKAGAGSVDLDVFECGSDERTVSTSLPVAVGDDSPRMTIEPQPAPDDQGATVDPAPGKPTYRR